MRQQCIERPGNKASMLNARSCFPYMVCVKGMTLYRHIVYPVHLKSIHSDNNYCEK